MIFPIILLLRKFIVFMLGYSFLRNLLKNLHVYKIYIKFLIFHPYKSMKTFLRREGESLQNIYPPVLRIYASIEPSNISGAE